MFNHDTDLFRIIMCHIVKRRIHSLMLPHNLLNPRQPSK